MQFIAVIVVVYLAALAWSQLKRKGRKLPPGPRPLPIVGNMFQVDGANVHHSFTQLSKKYGPLMSIRFGSKLNVVVSSPETAKIVLSKAESSDRPIFQALHSHDHMTLSVGLMPASDPKWKDLRKICKEQMFANHSLKKSQWLRHKKQLQLIDHVQRCCDAGRTVDIREAAFTTTLNHISATLFSVDAAEFDSAAISELKDIMMQIASAFGAANLADYFPILKYLDPQGVRRQTDRVFGRLFRHIQTHIDQRLESRRANHPNYRKPEDLLETLLDGMAPGSGYGFTLDDITHLLFDLYNAGSESSMMTIEWIMTELLLHPDKLSKAKDEVRKVVGDRKMIEEEDISRLPYLQAVIKETLRLHMPAPLLFPHMAREDMEIDGYFIPKGAQLLVNAWAIARDPSAWHDPESFEPERFLKENIDIKGQNFKLVPFGSGRRICPGMPLAQLIGHTAVAALIHNFDWKFAEGESERNGELLSGPALRREAPLMAIPMMPSAAA